MLYILKSSGKIGSQKHSAEFYIGFAEDDKFMKRINAHMRGKGSCFTRACIKQGHTLMLIALIEGTRNDERILKKAGKTSRIVDMLQRGKKPACVVGDIVFLQPTNWKECTAHHLQIFQVSMITQ